MWVVVLVVGSLVVGLIPFLLGAGPLIFIPLVLLLIGGGLGTRFGVKQALRRQQQITRIRHIREQAQEQKADFTPADRLTQTRTR